MSDDLFHLMAQLVVEHLVRTRGLAPAAATQLVQQLVDRAWADYQAAGAPLGDDTTGFLRWLLRLLPAPAA